MIWPGFDFASFTRSGTDLTGSDGCTDSMKGVNAIRVIGVKSLIGSYGSFL